MLSVSVMMAAAPVAMAANEDEAKARQARYDDCMKHSDDSAYCNCVADGGVKLNTDVPFVGKCINKNDTQNAFPQLV